MTVPKAVRRLPRRLRDVWEITYAAGGTDPHREAWTAVRREADAEKVTQKEVGVMGETGVLNCSGVVEGSVYSAVKSVRQRDGSLRWLTISTGVFEDRDGEVVPTAYVEQAVKDSDESGERGFLNLWHVPGSELGPCDFQLFHSGFLLESGTFYDTPWAAKAAGVIASGEKSLGVSVEFFHSGIDRDGVYIPPGDGSRFIVNRSVLPFAAAAFPWSGIALKEGGMDAEKLAKKRVFLEDMVGVEKATEILTAMELGGDALRAAGVRWKESGDVSDAVTTPAQEPVAEVTAEKAVTDSQEAASGSGEQPAEDIPDEQDDNTMRIVFDDDSVTLLASRVADMVMERMSPQFATKEAREVSVAQLLTEVGELRIAVKELAVDIDERVSQKVRELPRAAVLYRPSKQTPAAAEKETATDKAVGDVERGLKTLFGEEA